MPGWAHCCRASHRQPPGCQPGQAHLKADEEGPASKSVAGGRTQFLWAVGRGHASRATGPPSMAVGPLEMSKGESQNEQDGNQCSVALSQRC